MIKLYDVVNDDGVFIATRLSESTARHLAGCQVEETGVYHSVEPHNWELSKDAREFVGSGEDLETAARNAFEETRANGNGSPKWSKRVVAIGDNTGITAVSPEFGSMPTDFDRIMEELEDAERATAEHQSMIGIW